MNKEKFLSELSFLLQDISIEEREDALQYYRDYIDEAGEENEFQILAELQSPERVAALIKAGLDSNFDESIEYSESSMKNAGYSQQHEIIINDQKEQKKEKGDTYRKARIDNPIFILLIIAIVFVFGMPVFGVIFGIIAALFGFAVSFIGLGIGFCIAAILLIVYGIFSITVNVGIGLMMIGLGIIFSGLSIFFFSNVKKPFTVAITLFNKGTEVVKGFLEKVGINL